MSTSSESRWTEDEYTAYLEAERHLYAWALQRYGDFSESEASSEAEARYPYEPASVGEFRGSIFHWTSWFLAMEKVHGEFFYMDRPELENESKEYLVEQDRIFQRQRRRLGIRDD